MFCVSIVNLVYILDGIGNVCFHILFLATGALGIGQFPRRCTGARRWSDGHWNRVWSPLGTTHQCWILTVSFEFPAKPPRWQGCPTD
jgi:hypothetical protein